MLLLEPGPQPKLVQELQDLQLLMPDHQKQLITQQQPKLRLVPEFELILQEKVVKHLEL